METTQLTFAPTPRPAAAASHLALGLWMRGSIAGAALALAGVASLFSQPQAMPALIALTWVAAGGTFSWLCWQRASAHLDGIESIESRHAAHRPSKADLSLTGQHA
jgi:hypothetical protein